MHSCLKNNRNYWQRVELCVMRKLYPESLGPEAVSRKDWVPSGKSFLLFSFVARNNILSQITGLRSFIQYHFINKSLPLVFICVFLGTNGYSKVVSHTKYKEHLKMGCDQQELLQQKLGVVTTMRNYDLTSGIVTNIRNFD